MILFRDQLQVVDKPDGVLCIAEGASNDGNISCKVEIGKDKSGALFVVLCEFIDLSGIKDIK